MALNAEKTWVLERWSGGTTDVIKITRNYTVGRRTIFFRHDYGSKKPKTDYPEFTIKTSSDSKEAIVCNKSLLAECSDVFNAMFAHECIETRPNEVIIEDFSKVTLVEFVEFAYTRKLREEMRCCPIELLFMADKYQSQTLKDTCTKHLETHVTKENVVELLEASEILKIPILLHTVCDFLLNNNWKDGMPEVEKKLKKSPEFLLAFNIRRNRRNGALGM